MEKQRKNGKTNEHLCICLLDSTGNMNILPHCFYLSIDGETDFLTQHFESKLQIGCSIPKYFNTYLLKKKKKDVLPCDHSIVIKPKRLKLT